MDSDLLPISALQHYLYCPRQCALIHLEQQWKENMFTAEGRLLHERVDRPGDARRGTVRTMTALPIAHTVLNIGGVADVVEFHSTPEGERAYPVEYKRGKPKAHRADEVQLCAQALCLETMFGHPIPEGALYYGRTRRRKVVTMNEELRALTHTVIAGLSAMWAAQRTPIVTYERRRCDACSLVEICQPRLLGRPTTVGSWLRHQLES